ncbi:MAG TPA: hypothetical protein VKN18_10530 [Blastocatellia bacterium]|nr:hypothetical protein [Blastocatellia bacterium]
MPSRREVISSVLHSCAATAVAGAVTAEAGSSVAGAEQQRYLLIGLCGSENPTRANFPFAWASALKEAGHEVRLELAGDATVLMRTIVAKSVTPVGWPPLSEAIARVINHKIPIFV